MAYASIAGRARTSAKNPRAFGICDRCGFNYNHINLKWQFDYAGAGLINKRILVCDVCYDTPQAQLRAIVVPADPTPIMNARTENFAEASTDYMTIAAPTVKDPLTGIPIPSTTSLITQDGVNLTDQVVGRPTGYDPNAVMPLNGTTAYNVVLNPLSISANDTRTVTVTFSSAHNLSTNAQISVEGLSNNAADGIFSITVTTATAFTYQTNTVIKSGGLLQGNSRMATALVGLPYDYSQIPQTGA
jgi:hypothetical protein